MRLYSHVQLPFRYGTRHRTTATVLVVLVWRHTTRASQFNRSSLRTVTLLWCSEVLSFESYPNAVQRHRKRAIAPEERHALGRRRSVVVVVVVVVYWILMINCRRSGG